MNDTVWLFLSLTKRVHVKGMYFTKSANSKFLNSNSAKKTIIAKTPKSRINVTMNK